MGVFDKLSGKKKRGKYCAVCGRELLESETSPLFGIANMDFAEAARRAMLWTQMPAYVCEKCGATICNGCRPLTESPSHWKNFPQCPKCGSDMEGL